jgi:hypothetical protein
MTLEAMKHDDSLLWMQLNRCRITDKRARKLFTALKDNTSVTSIDLSDNVITDEGMQFMTGVLAGGIAPNLIHVNVRGNPVSERGKELLSGLFHLRKQLKVEYDMHEICNEGEGGCLDTDDKWGEGFPRNKWMSDCTEDGRVDHQWGTDSDTVNTLLTSQHQRARNPQVLQEQVCPQ